MLMIGSAALDGSPRVALAIDDSAGRPQVDEVVGLGVDVVELRIDQFASLESGAVLREVARFDGLNLLGTIRRVEEGGGWSSPEEERLALYRAVLPQVHAVDVEIQSGAAADVLAEARKLGRLGIASYHNFELTPEREALSEMVAQGVELGADVVKVAAHCRDWAELRRLARFAIAYAEAEVPMIVIGMGAYGAPSRVFFPALGSLLTYTFLGKPTAPGQLNCADTIQYLSGVFPNFGR